MHLGFSEIPRNVLEYSAAEIPLRQIAPKGPREPFAYTPHRRPTRAKAARIR